MRVGCRSVHTVQSPASFQLVVKHSRFIAHVKGGVQCKEDAMAFIEEVKDSKATHNCYAYKVGAEERASDDGEVAGTAGKQILSGMLTPL
jgi:putative IMPACT (imprinted ancient) family translation regulator